MSRYSGVPVRGRRGGEKVMVLLLLCAGSWDYPAVVRESVIWAMVGGGEEHNGPSGVWGQLSPDDQGLLGNNITNTPPSALRQTFTEWRKTENFYFHYFTQIL